jgi:putative spermidine/putrescine transport system ATP-binding protein
LGALDKKLREHMQIELKQLHDSLGITIIYVTHDQSEALTMSDRVAVFESGTVVQIGTPDALYNQPASAFVANFIGENNTLEGTVAQSDGACCVIALPGGSRIAARAIGIGAVGTPALVAVRPERIALGGDAGNRLPGRVTGRIYLGDHVRLLVELENGAVVTVKVGTDQAQQTEDVTLVWSPEDCRAFPTTGHIDEIAKPGRFK